MTAPNTSHIHVFENAGLGKAPFKLVDFYAIPAASLAEHNPHAYNNMLAAMPRDVGCGSCAYCGTALVNNFIIQSADGKKNAVGCDCVNKVGDRGLVDAIKLKKRELAREKRAAERMAKWEAEQAAIAQAEEAERAQNGGLTHAELHEQKVAALTAEFEAKVDNITDTLKPLLDAIRPKRDNSDFVRNVGSHIAHGQFLQISDRMWKIILDIAAKQVGGRANSKAYWAKYETFEQLVDAAREQFDTLNKQYNAQKDAL